MSNFSQFLGGVRPPKNIVNSCSTAGFTSFSVGTAALPKQILSGAVTAGTFKTVLSVTGQGSIDFLSFYQIDGTTRSASCRLTIDGTVVFNSSYAAISSSLNGGIAVGAVVQPASAVFAIPQSVSFNNSFLVELTSTLSETDKVAIGVIYKTY